MENQKTEFKDNGLTRKGGITVKRGLAQMLKGGVIMDVVTPEHAVIAKCNAFGRQVDSFETNLFVPVLENGAAEPFHAVFIRAPYIAAVRGNAVAIAKLSDGTAVAVREGKWLATAFHPELTSDLRFHRYFLRMISDN